jgi:hypothetical protein
VARPVEYDNLLKVGSFKVAASSREAITQFLRTADDMLAGAQIALPDAARHRVTAIQRVAVDLGLDATRQSVLGRLHDVRNRVTYRQPLPPITKADADALQRILEEMLPPAKVLTGV